jgi:hypothetical protein
VISWKPVMRAFGLNKIWKFILQKGQKGTMEMSPPECNDREDPASLTRMYNAIQKFNRNTTWVATGLLGSVIFAALIIALQDRQSKADDLVTKAGQSRANLFPRTAGVAMTDSAPIDKSDAETISEQPAKLSRRESTQVMNQAEVKPDATPQSQVSADSARSTNERNQGRPQSSVRSRYVGAKARLIALWHQQLRRQKSPGWTLSNEWRKKKISYTAATNH